MNGEILAVASAATLLACEGIAILARSQQAPHNRSLASLSLFVVLLATVLAALFSSGRLAFSPEFGIVMMEGGWAARALITLLMMAIAICAGLGCHLARTWAGWPTRPIWLLAISATVSLLAAWRLQPVDSDDFQPLGIYAYDVWWPPFLIWLGFSLVEIGLAILKFREPAIRLLVQTLTVSGLCYLALAQPELADPDSEALWKNCQVAVFLLALVLVNWLFLPALWGKLRQFGWWGRLGFTLISVGLLLGSLAILPRLAGLVVWGVWLLLAVFATLREVYSVWRGSDPKRWGLHAKHETLAFLTLPAIAWCVLDLVVFARMDPVFDLLGLVFIWVLFVDVSADGLLSPHTGWWVMNFGPHSHPSGKLRAPRTGGRTRPGTGGSAGLSV